MKTPSLCSGLLVLAVLMFTPSIADAAPPREAPQVSVRSIKVEGEPGNLLIEQGKLYVSCFKGENLSVFDTRSRRLTKRIYFDAYESFTPILQNGNEVGRRRTVHRCPPGDTVAANGKLFVGQVFSESVVVFDIPTMWVVKRLPLGGQGNFAASSDGKKVYFASNERNEFHIIDTETYQYKSVPYPAGGRGIGAIALSPDDQRLYLGIQRGGKAPDGKEHGGGNSFLAVYDLREPDYIATAYLAEIKAAGNSDDSIPSKLLFSPDGKLLYAGMFQSLAGIRVVDTGTWKITRDISFPPSARNTHPGRWADPMSLAIYRDWLLSVNRANRELAVVDRTTHTVVAKLAFAEDRHRLTDIVVQGDRIYLSDAEARCLHEINGRKLTKQLRQVLRQGNNKPLEMKVVPR